MTGELRITQLEHAKETVVRGIDHAIHSLKGAVEFRDAVEHMLDGTPFEKPAGDDILGLYGRLRDALRSGGVIK